jgi:hypothetical protein
MEARRPGPVRSPGIDHVKFATFEISRVPGDQDGVLRLDNSGDLSIEE